MAETTTSAPVHTKALPTTPSPLPTEFYGTLTVEADPRLDSYLFPADIDPEIAQVIQLVLIERQHYTARHGKQFTTFVLVKPLEKTTDGHDKAYLFTRSLEFYVEDGELKQGGGGQIPAALTLEKKPEGWHVEMETPSGGDWGTRLREIFPEEVLALFANFPRTIGDAINQNLIQQAESYYGLEFDENKNSYLFKGDTPAPAIVLLTLTPTPTLDLLSIIPNVRASSLVTSNQISIGVNLYDGVTREFQKGLVSADWHVYLFIRTPDGNYPLESGLLLDSYKDYAGASGHEFILRLPLEDILEFSGENRGLVYQVIDKSGEIFWEEEIYLDLDLVHTYFIDEGRDFPNDFPQAIGEGVFTGTPNLMTNKNILIFTQDDGEFTVQEPPGGFHSLSYQYGLIYAPEMTEARDINDLSESIVIELHPYNENGVYNPEDALILEGEVSGGSGILSVDFSHSWLDEDCRNIEKNLLIIRDPEGTFYKEIIFQFKPSEEVP